jgi:putative tricarboxylic transport membrane protein
MTYQQRNVRPSHEQPYLQAFPMTVQEAGIPSLRSVVIQPLRATVTQGVCCLPFSSSRLYAIPRIFETKCLPGGVQYLLHCRNDHRKPYWPGFPILYRREKGLDRTVDVNGKRTQKIVAFCLLLFALLYLILALRLKMGRPGNQGPGFVPLLIGVSLVGCTATLLLRLFKAKPAQEEADESAPGGGPRYRTLIGIVLSMAAYPLLLGPLNFIVSTWIACFAMMLFLKPRSYIASLLMSMGVAVGCFVIFASLFGVALPAGPLEGLLFRLGG